MEVDVQVACDSQNLPTPREIAAWVETALEGERTDAEVTVRIVDEEEGAKLNRVYRGQPNPTNVLSFPCEGAAELGLALLGDIVICAPVVEREARAQHKEVPAHWAHLVVHGTLHLLGYDHQSPRETEHMETTERAVMDRLGFSDPYAT